MRRDSGRGHRGYGIGLEMTVGNEAEGEAVMFQRSMVVGLTNGYNSRAPLSKKQLLKFILITLENAFSSLQRLSTPK